MKSIPEQIADMPPTMALTTPIGDSVIFTGEGGYPFERAAANEVLVVGLAYTLAALEIDNWKTSIKLHGVGGWFNSVMFSNVVAK